MIPSPLARAGGVICLGLYRKCFESDGSVAGYVVTNPHPNTELKDDDLVIAPGLSSDSGSTLRGWTSCR